MAHLHDHLSRHDESAAIFSPSVARIAASTARDWSHVESWLASKFPPGRALPSFERNQDTLKALLVLATANEAADEQRQLLARADASALAENRGRASTGSKPDNHALRPHLLREDLLTLIQRQLPHEGTNALDCLAKVAVQARTAFAEPQRLGCDIMSLQGTLFELEQMVARLDSLERQIQLEAEQTASLLRMWQRDSFRPPPDSAKENLDLQRKIKSMSSHLDNLRDHAAAKMPPVNASHPTIGDVSLQEKDLLALLSCKKELDAQIAAFEGLPNDPIKARSELDALRRQLQTFSSHRDAVFEGLVERESPVRRR
ncbi:hypothetical protein HRG_011055 [Hirsutella rhossiliensis]|uniref:HAUS augmin-like complex subunit 1 n=1 Tax=Hirsutella rhossiliensis TaxID=111463 RepID=A0A9P8MMD0_9HYPO|nr:uncharacterized protein HRG_11055 [Hirsutella rhossiliensis]KAH0957962.1 hypothetical protein HRG_11055 [Hirsutella rhossiliensis]